MKLPLFRFKSKPALVHLWPQQDLLHVKLFPLPFCLCPFTHKALHLFLSTLGFLSSVIPWSQRPCSHHHQLHPPNMGQAWFFPPPTYSLSLFSPLLTPFEQHTFQLWGFLTTQCFPDLSLDSPLVGSKKSRIGPRSEKNFTSSAFVFLDFFFLCPWSPPYVVSI